MNRLAIWKGNDPQIMTDFRDIDPVPYPSILLYFNASRIS